APTPETDALCVASCPLQDLSFISDRGKPAAGDGDCSRVRPRRIQRRELAVLQNRRRRILVLRMRAAEQRQGRATHGRLQYVPAFPLSIHKASFTASTSIVGLASSLTPGTRNFIQ